MTTEQLFNKLLDDYGFDRDFPLYRIPREIRNDPFWSSLPETHGVVIHWYIDEMCSFTKVKKVQE